MAIAEEGTVTAAARKLGMSQPAVSSALAKLRHSLRDPLFVRTARGMESTPRTLALLQPVRLTMEIVTNELLQTAPFDPTKTDKTFSIALSDVGEMVVLPSILAHLSKVAPKVNLRSISMPPTQLQRAMELGEVDLALGYFPDLTGTNFYQQRLYSQGFVGLLRADHPIKGPRLTMRQFKQLGHAVVRAEGRSQEVLERFLAKRKIHRREVLQTPHFLSVPYIITQSDLLATVPMALGTSFARSMNLRLILPPFDVPHVVLRQHWHRKFHHDPQNKWLRGTVHSLINDSLDALHR